MRINGSQKRLETKTSEQRFKQMLEQEFHFAPKIAQSILEEAQLHLVEPTGSNGVGRQQVILAKREAGHGRPLRETELIQVSWTVDAGSEDPSGYGAAFAL